MPVCDRVSSGQGKVREIPYQAKVRELSGNFVMGQGKLKMLGKVREFWTGHCYGIFMSNLKHFGQHPHSLLMELLASVTWMSSSYDSFWIVVTMLLIIFPFQDWFVILFAKLCLNSYGTRVNQYCESNVTRGQGKQKMVREKSGNFMRGNCWTPCVNMMM